MASILEYLNLFKKEQKPEEKFPISSLETKIEDEWVVLPKEEIHDSTTFDPTICFTETPIVEEYTIPKLEHSTILKPSTLEESAVLESSKGEFTSLSPISITEIGPNLSSITSVGNERHYLELLMKPEIEILPKKHRQLSKKKIPSGYSKPPNPQKIKKIKPTTFARQSKFYSSKKKNSIQKRN